MAFETVAYSRVLQGRAMPSDQTIDPHMAPQIERCFKYAQKCLEMSDRLGPGDDSPLLLEMAEAWADFQRDPDGKPRGVRASANELGRPFTLKA